MIINFYGSRRIIKYRPQISSSWYRLRYSTGGVDTCNFITRMSFSLLYSSWIERYCRVLHYQLISAKIIISDFDESYSDSLRTSHCISCPVQIPIPKNISLDIIRTNRPTYHREYPSRNTRLRQTQNDRKHYQSRSIETRISFREDRSGPTLDLMKCDFPNVKNDIEFLLIALHQGTMDKYRSLIF